MISIRSVAGVAVVVATATAISFAGRQQPTPANTTQPLPVVAAAQKPADNKGREADLEAIRKSARDYAEAFNKADAKAIAAMWTEDAECREATGETFVGRAAIEKAYADLFKRTPGAKIDVLIKSIRFPGKDIAIEEGLVRQTRHAKDLPGSTSYVVIHVREGGKWLMSLSSESGVGQDRLEDLEWLIGEWTTKVKDDAVTFTISKDPKKPRIVAKFSRTPAGKDPIEGNIHIAFDPETGRLRSWGFEDDGAHSQALWFCDGKSWIIDARGVTADGTPTAERIILQRVAPDAITWRVVDRVLGDTPVKDTPPMRLTRTTKK